MMLSIEPNLYEVFGVYCRRKGIKKSQLISKLMRDYLKCKAEDSAEKQQVEKTCIDCGSKYFYPAYAECPACKTQRIKNNLETQQTQVDNVAQDIEKIINTKKERLSKMITDNKKAKKQNDKAGEIVALCYSANAILNIKEEISDLEKEHEKAKNGTACIFDAEVQK